MDALRDKYGLRGPLNKRGFYRVCNGEGICTDFSDMEEQSRTFAKYFRGMAMTVEGKHSIILRCYWRSRFDAFVAGHELGHVLLRHSGNESMILAFTDRAAYKEHWHEVEANLFAELLLHP